MPITPEQRQAAQARQHAAAHDSSPQVRVVAGPGTGKSFAIQERVQWLLDNGISPRSIYVVSFTRASSRDLRQRIRSYCTKRGHPTSALVSVSTLHSLALRALRHAGLLYYPSDPVVMDQWELKNVFDPEFSRFSGYRPSGDGSGFTPGRCKEIRGDYEAFCGTGQWSPPSFIPDGPPVTPEERDTYRAFHGPRTQAYCCVLPGEIVRQCVEHMKSGLLAPEALLGIEHLVVDEYQDLNPVDLEFVDRLVHKGVRTLVAGDDDQSIYSFRFASPHGIQSFISRHPNAGDHRLEHCFRCATDILAVGQALIRAFPQPGRIPKSVVSLFGKASPPLAGVVKRWRFANAALEARCVAESCSKLIAAGIAAKDIMVLIANPRIQLASLQSALKAYGVPFGSPRAGRFIDTRLGRLVLVLLRIVCNEDDYLAHRVLLGLQPGAGAGTCNCVADAVVANSLNYRDLFYQPLPTDVMDGRMGSVLNKARSLCAQISDWEPSDALSLRNPDISRIVANTFGETAMQSWLALSATLPQGISLEETLDYLWADTDEQQALTLEEVYNRLGMAVPAGGLLPPEVRLMTMHGAKGLGAHVVFIPGLEEGILPASKARGRPGELLESARLLYVSITRARAACVLSYAERRTVYGGSCERHHSRFAAHLNGPFASKSGCLSDRDVAQIVWCCDNLGA